MRFDLLLLLNFWSFDGRGGDDYKWLAQLSVKAANLSFD